MPKTKKKPKSFNAVEGLVCHRCQGIVEVVGGPACNEADIKADMNINDGVTMFYRCLKCGHPTDPVKLGEHINHHDHAPDMCYLLTFSNTGKREDERPHSLHLNLDSLNSYRDIYFSDYPTAIETVYLCSLDIHKELTGDEDLKQKHKQISVIRG